MTGALGAGGLLAGRIGLDRRPRAVAVAVTMAGCAVTLAVSHALVLVATAQILLAVLLVTAGIHLTRLMHDAVPSSVRTGVASGVSTLSRLVFLPGALLYGLVSRHYGIAATGWLVTGFAALAGLLLVRLSRPVGNLVAVPDV